MFFILPNLSIQQISDSQNFPKISFFSIKNPSHSYLIQHKASVLTSILVDFSNSAFNILSSFAIGSGRAIGQGIGMALYEGVDYTPNGYVKQNSFMQYKVPSRVDVGKLRVEFESSYEPTGPFGAKSIGEIVINTPSPALAHAVFNATGLWIRELPMTSEEIVMGLLEQEQ